MAKLAATNYYEIYAFLQMRNRMTYPIGHNTKAKLFLKNNKVEIRVTLHDHLIAILHQDGTVDATLAGYDTVTTRNRLNQLAPEGWTFRPGYVEYKDGSKKPIYDPYNDWFNLTPKLKFEDLDNPCSEVQVVPSWSGNLKIGDTLDEPIPLPLHSMVVDGDDDVWTHMGKGEWCLHGETDAYSLNRIMSDYPPIKLLSIGAATTTDLTPEAPVVESADEDSDLWPMEAV